MEEETLNENTEEEITPRYLLTLLMPMIKDELIAKCRYDREGIRLKFPNGQQFHISVTEMK